MEKIYRKFALYQCVFFNFENQTNVGINFDQNKHFSFQIVWSTHTLNLVDKKSLLAILIISKNPYFPIETPKTLLTFFKIYSDVNI